LLGDLKLELDGGSNLGHFSLHEVGAGIALGVVLCKNSEGLIIAIFADKPTGAFRKQAVNPSA
jgi:hypothetical protein